MNKFSFFTGLGVATSAVFLDPIWTLLVSGKAWAPYALGIALAATSLLAVGTFAAVRSAVGLVSDRWLDDRFDADLFAGGAVFGAALAWTWLYPSPGAPPDHLHLAALASVGMGLLFGVTSAYAIPSSRRARAALRTLPALGAALLGFVWFQKYEAGSLFSVPSLLSVVAGAIFVGALAALSIRAPERTRWVPLVTLGAVLVGLTATVGGRAFEPVSGPTTPEREASPSVLLLTIDTLRADRFDCAKGRGLTLLCEHGIEFEGFSPAPWTLPALASIHSGVSPLVHGALGKASRLDPEFATLAEVLRKAGYRTHAISHSAIVRPSRGLLQGFQSYDLFPSKTPSSYTARLARMTSDRLPPRIRLDSTPTSIASLAFDWIEEHHGRPFFLWVHQYDPHAPYHPPPAYRAPRERDRFSGRFNKLREIVEGSLIPSPAEKLEIQALYDAEVEYVRDETQQLLERLDEKGWADKLLIVLTSDHGEEFFEHGRAGHGHTLYDELLRVPIVLKFPGASSASSRGPASTTQIAATILDALGLERPHDHLAPPLTLEIPPDDHVAGGMLYFEPQIAVRTSEFKYIWMPESDRHEVYDLAAEPEERSNLGASRADLLEAGRSLLDQHLSDAIRARTALGFEDGASTSVDPDAEQQLRALGYIQ